MTTPDSTKHARFSLEVHAQLMALARDLDGTADDALRHLLGMSTVRVPVSDLQRARWTAAAHAIGLSVDEFVRVRMEAFLAFGGNPATLYGIYTGVYELCRKAGLNPPLVDPHAPLMPPPSTQSTEATPQ
jgi:hypothetical protein